MCVCGVVRNRRWQHYTKNLLHYSLQPKVCEHSEHPIPSLVPSFAIITTATLLREWKSFTINWSMDCMEHVRICSLSDRADVGKETCRDSRCSSSIPKMFGVVEVRALTRENSPEIFYFFFFPSHLFSQIYACFMHKDKVVHRFGPLSSSKQKNWNVTAYKDIQVSCVPSTVATRPIYRYDGQMIFQITVHHFISLYDFNLGFGTNYKKKFIYLYFYINY